MVYYLKDEASVNLLFEDDDKINNIEITYGTLIISDLMQKLKIYDCTIIDGDIFDGEFGTEMGTILYKSSKKKFPLMFMIPSLWSPIVWLIVKVFNTSMKWPIFIIIGLTPVFILFVIIFIIFLAKKDDNAFITVCDEGIVLSGIYKYRAISYKKITKIDYDRRIVIFTDKKITLPNTKDKLELYNKICYYYKIYNDNK